MVTLCKLLVTGWRSRQKLDPEWTRHFDWWEVHLRDSGPVWVSAQLEAALARATGEPVKGDGWTLLQLYQPKPAWERALDALETELAIASPKTEEATSQERLVWFVSVYGDEYLQLEPRLQKRRGRSWTSGRPVSTKRLAEESDASWLNPQDVRAAATIRAERTRYGHRFDFSEQTAAALVGHPHVFLEDDGTPLEVVQAEPELRIERKDKKITVRLEPPLQDRLLWFELDRAARQLRVCAPDAQLRRLSRPLGKGLKVPAEAEARVKKLLSKASPILRVHSQVEAEASAAQPRPADPRPVLRLSRRPGGMRVRTRVCPLGLEGPQLLPGQGGAQVIATVGGQLLSCERDLALESKNARLMEERCPTLARGDLQGDVIELSSVSDCLELLLELGALEDQVQLTWPEGEPLRVLGERGASALRLHLKRAKDWFSADGALQVDEALELSLRELLERMPQASGRFIQLDEERYLALTEGLREKLRLIAAAAAKQRKRAVELPPIAASVVTGWAAELGSLKTDREAGRLKKRALEAAALEASLPETFEAELRPYQLEGYRWLCRLSHLGAGACLADDMGLGKTIQSLALMVHRAQKGPALVVAPTSVCPNWEMEAARFAPALRCLRLDRSDELPQKLDAFDLLIASYAMMTRAINKLEKVRFSTLVLDEAQAIKNPEAQRTKAALRLDADFRMVTTGTPIENHLGELWSIMRFLNPGCWARRLASRSALLAPSRTTVMSAQGSCCAA